jgi:hypothetical protein
MCVNVKLRCSVYELVVGCYGHYKNAVNFLNEYLFLNKDPLP